VLNSLEIDKSPKDTRVVVAMSGGVDSSVVAVMLKKQGYDVIGITLQLYDHGKIIEKKGACCAGADIHDAKTVAEDFNFPHYVLNYESLFKESVIDDFADSYLRGETPIPCVKCNQSVKFKDLLKVAQDLGADVLATGHYVQRKIGKDGAQLHKAVGIDKDQSYFLFATTKTQLDFLRFPLGGFTKQETRKKALEFGLKIADKPDSQDICFVPDGNYAQVISKMRPSAFKEGNIVDLEGNILGKHNGIINYTIGQRKGLGISSPDPLYVIKINAKENKVIVGQEAFLGKQTFAIKDLNWLAQSQMFEKPFNAFVRLRSSQIEVEAKITINFNNKTAQIELFDPARSVTPGQACVIYLGDRVLGGGWIVLQ
jgi:tRNA-specific 2-thiouridylase